LTHDTKFEGSNPAATGPGREEIAKKYSVKLCLQVAVLTLAPCEATGIVAVLALAPCEATVALPWLLVQQLLLL